MIGPPGTGKTILARRIPALQAAQLLRSRSQQIQKRTGTTDEQRGGLDITIPDTEPTPVPAPTTALSLNIVNAERLRHVAAFKA